MAKSKIKRVSYVDETIEWFVEYYSPTYGIMKTNKFTKEEVARDYFDEKKEEGRKELKIIRRTITIEDIEEYA